MLQKASGPKNEPRYQQLHPHPCTACHPASPVCHPLLGTAVQVSVCCRPMLKARAAAVPTCRRGLPLQCRRQAAAAAGVSGNAARISRGVMIRLYDLARQAGRSWPPSQEGLGSGAWQRRTWRNWRSIRWLPQARSNPGSVWAATGAAEADFRQALSCKAAIGRKLAA